MVSSIPNTNNHMVSSIPNTNNHMVSSNYFYLIKIFSLQKVIWFQVTNDNP